VLRELNRGNRRMAADAFLMWRIGGPGLIDRRKRERQMFLKREPNQYAFFTDSEEKLAREYDRLKREDKRPVRRRELRVEMARRRKAIHAVATREKNGWNKKRRLERYRALRDRST
jgi:hypothetical protein